MPTHLKALRHLSDAKPNDECPCSRQSGRRDTNGYPAEQAPWVKRSLSFRGIRHCGRQFLVSYFQRGHWRPPQKFSVLCWAEFAEGC